MKAQSAQSSRNWSCVLTSIILILSTINLQLQGWILPISLKSVLGIVKDGVAYVVATVWSSSS